MKKILITGGVGLLGSALAVSSLSRFEVFVTSLQKADLGFCESYIMDITNKEQVFSVLKQVNPDFLIHTAGLVSVAFCELNQEIAYNVNVKGTENIARACIDYGIKMIHTSTNYVFDGKKGNYSEADKPNPINVYAKTKLDSEKIVKKLIDNPLIVRVTPYGWNIEPRVNSATQVIEILKKGQVFSALTDWYNSPILANNCADLILDLIKKDKTGLYHLAGNERISRYNFSLKIAEIFNLDKTLIKPITHDFLKEKAKRPLDTSLCIDKLKNETKIKILNIDEGLKQMKKIYSEDYLKSFKNVN